MTWKRYRETDSREALAGTIDYWDYSGTYSELGPGYTHGSYGDFKSISDVNVPNFFKRIKDGELIVNPMFIDKRHRSMSVSSYEEAHYNIQPIHKFNMAGEAAYAVRAKKFSPLEHVPDALFELGTLRTLAGTEAAANIQSPDVAGMVFLGELRETIRMLKNPVGSILRAARRIQKTKNKDSRFWDKTVADFVSANWLQYRYGIMPLMFTYQDLLVALDKVGDVAPRYRALGAADQTKTTSDLEEVSNDATWGFSYERSRETQTEMSVRAGIMYTMDRRDSFGLNLRHLPITAWELTPFSFVLDWFLNTGDYIQAISPKIGVKKLAGWTTEKVVRSTSGTGTSTGFSKAGWTADNGSSWVEQFDQTTLQRRVGAPSAGLATHYHPFSGDIGAKRIVDSISLINQVFLAK